MLAAPQLLKMVLAAILLQHLVMYRQGVVEEHIMTADPHIRREVPGVLVAVAMDMTDKIDQGVQEILHQ